jgi:hypothetical protein
MTGANPNSAVPHHGRRSEWEPDQVSFAIPHSLVAELPTKRFANGLFSVTLDGTPWAGGNLPNGARLAVRIWAPIVQQTDVPEPRTGALIETVLIGFLMAKQRHGPAWRLILNYTPERITL